MARFRFCATTKREPKRCDHCAERLGGFDHHSVRHVSPTLRAHIFVRERRTLRSHARALGRRGERIGGALVTARGAADGVVCHADGKGDGCDREGERAH
eukprot:399777-Prymnesium_polylepis.1